MERNKQISVRRPLGGLDRDSELSKIAPENFPYANNIDGGYGVSVSGLVPHDGLVEISYDGLPQGSTYEVIGAFEIRPRKSVLYFLADTSVNDKHLILESNESGVAELLQGDFLNFSAENRIHSCVFIDGLVYWTDGRDYNGTPLGNPPRVIDIARHRPGKIITYRLICNLDAFNAGTEFRAQLLNLDGTAIDPAFLFLTVPATGAPEDVMLAIFNALDTAGFDVVPFDENTSENPATYVDFSWPVEDTRVQIGVQGPTGTPIAEIYERNFYPLPSSVDNYERQITVIKPPPSLAPEVQYEQDSLLRSGSLGIHALKFRCRYIFTSGEKSSWGPYSIVPTNYTGTNPELADNDGNFNAIRIAFEYNDPLLEMEWRGLVSHVEIAVLSSVNGIVSHVEKLALDDYFLGELEYVYTGSRILPAVASDENADANVQALKSFDDVPLIALGLESVYDESGNTLLLLGGGLYDYDLPNSLLKASFVETQLTPTLPTPQISENKGLKRGGRYGVGIVFKDAWGRQSSVVAVEKITIPWSKFVNPLGNTYWTAYHLQTNITGTLPSWAEYYQIVISENLNQGQYFQAITASVSFIDFIITPDGTTEVAFGGIAGSDREYTGFQLIDSSVIGAIEDDLGQATLFEDTNNVNYQFLPATGDRIHVQYWEGSFISPAYGNLPVAADVENYNYAVAGYLIFTDRSTPDNILYYVLVENEDDAPRFDSYNPTAPVVFHIEVYRPKSSPVTDILYEFGAVQRILDGITIRQITHEWYGDTFIQGRPQAHAAVKNPIVGYDDFDFQAVEQPTMDKFDESPLNDLGRAVLFDDAYKSLYRENLIKFSDSTQPGGEVRGASSFRGTNNIRLGDNWGPVRKLVFNQNVLLAIMSDKTQPIYVAKDRLMDLSGANFVGRADKLFNIADELMLDLGTHFPESVVYEQGQTFGFDLRTGRMWRYTSGGGQVVISDRGVISEFQEIANSITDLQGVHVISGYRRSTESLYVRCDNKCLIFKNKENLWRGFVDMPFEALVSVGLDAVAFNGGKPYLIDPGATKAFYFTAQQEPQIDLAFNDQADLMKVWDSMEIAATNGWYLHEVITKGTGTYPGGMRSAIPDNLWSEYEGRRKSDFLRDENDPSYEFAIIADPTERAVTARLRGRVIRGDIGTIKLRQSSPGESSELRSVYLNWVPSETIIKQ